MQFWPMWPSKRWKATNGSHRERCWTGLAWQKLTPGPLILVLPFVGFLAAFRNPGSLDPMIAGIFGAMLTTWATFVPCFLWVLFGGPYVEALRGNKSLNTVMSSITAAIVGVVLNLAVWFALHTVFGSIRDVYILGARLQIPLWNTINIPTLLIAIFAMLAIFRFKLGVIQTIGCSARSWGSYTICFSREYRDLAPELKIRFGTHST